MTFFSLNPEVAGGLGHDTILDRSCDPPRVANLHYELEGWLGDDLLESFPCYIITRRLANAIQATHLQGYELAAVKITTSDQFRELYPEREVPEFLWLKITGMAGKDDFGIAADNRLTVSDRALSVLQSTQLRNCDVSDYPT